MEKASQLAAVLAAQALHKPEGQQILTSTEIVAFYENYVIAEYSLKEYLNDKAFTAELLEGWKNCPNN